MYIYIYLYIYIYIYIYITYTYSEVKRQTDHGQKYASKEECIK